LAARDRSARDGAVLRGLSGSDWLTGDEGKVRTGESIKTIAAGSTVVVGYQQGTPSEMTIMYHMDGPNTLLANHYCAARNVPQWRFVPSSKPGEIRFDFDGGTNLNPKVDVHAHGQVIQVIDQDTYTESYTSVAANGKERTGAPIMRRRAPMKSKS
jgi:hypothetical protein